MLADIYNTGWRKMEHDNKMKSSDNCEDIYFLEGFFFIRNEVMKRNDDMVREAFQDLYKYVSFN